MNILKGITTQKDHMERLICLHRMKRSFILGADKIACSPKKMCFFVSTYLTIVHIATPVFMQAPVTSTVLFIYILQLIYFVIHPHKINNKCIIRKITLYFKWHRFSVFIIICLRFNKPIPLNLGCQQNKLRHMRYIFTAS